VLAATYLSIWLGFGFACYVVLNAFPVPWAAQGLVGGVALVVAALYGLTPIKAANEARCRELCSLYGPLPFSLVRSALVAGARYGLSCVGCSAGLMAAMAIIGMSDLGWVVIRRPAPHAQACASPKHGTGVVAFSGSDRDGGCVRNDGLGHRADDGWKGLVRARIQPVRGAPPEMRRAWVASTSETTRRER
jgi:hypothetical protein